MNGLPRSVVIGRRTAGVILVLCALATIVVLLVLVTSWATAPRVVGALGPGADASGTSWSAPVL